MVWAVARVRREGDTGYLVVRVRFWRRRADYDAGQPPDHVNDFRLDCPLWPDPMPVQTPYEPGTNTVIPRDQIVRGMAVDWREETISPDVRAHVRAVIRRYVARLRANVQTLDRDGRDDTLALRAADAYLNRADIQALATEMDDDGDA